MVCPPIIAQPCAAGLLRLRRAAAKDFRNHFVRDKVSRDSHDVQRSERTAAHRVNVGDRIGGGDLTVAKRVVHDGGEEVHRLHQRAIFR